MKKEYILITFAILALVTLKGATADDLQTTMQLGGDTETIFSLNFAGSEVPDTVIVNNNVPTGGGGGGGSMPTPKFYDLNCQTLRTTVNSQSVQATCNIKYSGATIPQQNGILQYWVVGPDGKKLPWLQQVIKEGSSQQLLSYKLPPDTPAGQYTLVTNWIPQDSDKVQSVNVFDLTQTKSSNTTTWVIGGIVLGLFVTALVIGFKKKEANE